MISRKNKPGNDFCFKAYCLALFFGTQKQQKT